LGCQEFFLKYFYQKVFLNKYGQDLRLARWGRTPRGIPGKKLFVRLLYQLHVAALIYDNLIVLCLKFL